MPNTANLSSNSRQAKTGAQPTPDYSNSAIDPTNTSTTHHRQTVRRSMPTGHESHTFHGEYSHVLDESYHSSANEGNNFNIHQQAHQIASGSHPPMQPNQFLQHEQSQQFLAQKFQQLQVQQQPQTHQLITQTSLDSDSSHHSLNNRGASMQVQPQQMQQVQQPHMSIQAQNLTQNHQHSQQMHTQQHQSQIIPLNQLQQTTYSPPPQQQQQLAPMQPPLQNFQPSQQFVTSYHHQHLENQQLQQPQQHFQLQHLQQSQVSHQSQYGVNHIQPGIHNAGQTLGPSPLQLSMQPLGQFSGQVPDNVVIGMNNRNVVDGSLASNMTVPTHLNPSPPPQNNVGGNFSMEQQYQHISHHNHQTQQQLPNIQHQNQIHQLQQYHQQQLQQLQQLQQIHQCSPEHQQQVSQFTAQQQQQQLMQPPLNPTLYQQLQPPILNPVLASAAMSTGHETAATAASTAGALPSTAAIMAASTAMQQHDQNHTHQQQILQQQGQKSTPPLTGSITPSTTSLTVTNPSKVPSTITTIKSKNTANTSVTTSTTNRPFNHTAPGPPIHNRAIHRIHLSSLRHNFSIVQSAAARQQCQVITVVKADGYGHGAIPTACHLVERCGADAFAVATLEEGVALRRALEERFIGGGKLGNAMGNVGEGGGHASHSGHANSGGHTDSASAASTNAHFNIPPPPQHMKQSLSPPRVRILVLGAPVGYPSCFDTYLYYGIELMVSGPEVAASLAKWMKDHEGRKRAEVARVAERRKEEVMSMEFVDRHPMRSGVVRQVQEVPEAKKEEPKENKDEQNQEKELDKEQECEKEESNDDKCNTTEKKIKEVNGMNNGEISSSSVSNNRDGIGEKEVKSSELAEDSSSKLVIGSDENKDKVTRKDSSISTVSNASTINEGANVDADASSNPSKTNKVDNTDKNNKEEHPQVCPSQLQTKMVAATLTNVTGADLAREVRQILIGQRHAAVSGPTNPSKPAMAVPAVEKDGTKTGSVVSGISSLENTFRRLSSVASSSGDGESAPPANKLGDASTNPAKAMTTLPNANAATLPAAATVPSAVATATTSAPTNTTDSDASKTQAKSGASAQTALAPPPLGTAGTAAGGTSGAGVTLFCGIDDAAKASRQRELRAIRRSRLPLEEENLMLEEEIAMGGPPVQVGGEEEGIGSDGSSGPSTAAKNMASGAKIGSYNTSNAASRRSSTQNTSEPPQIRKKLRWHALVDSGMGRLGFKTEKVIESEQPALPVEDCAETNVTATTPATTASTFSTLPKEERGETSTSGDGAASDASVRSTRSMSTVLSDRSGGWSLSSQQSQQAPQQSTQKVSQQLNQQGSQQATVVRDTVTIIKELYDAEVHDGAPIEFYGMCTHMADANSTSTYTHAQMDRFKSLLHRVRSADIAVPTVSTDNSAALLTTTLTHFDPYTILSHDTRGYVRTGGAIYGQRPAFRQLRAVSTLAATVKHVAVIQKGESVGYDRAYVAPMDVRIATLTVGFADGYPRDLGNGVGQVSIRGATFPVAGNVCMDMLMVELGPAEDREGVGSLVTVGDVAVLWGPEGMNAEECGDGLVRLADLAATLKTTQSALTCGLDKLRVQRHFID